MKNTFLCAAMVVLSCGFVLGQQYKVLNQDYGIRAHAPALLRVLF
jgi:hypothetical protein